MSNGLSGGDMAGNVGGDFVRIPRFLLEDSPQLAKKMSDFEDMQRKAQEAAAVLGGINKIEGIKAQLKTDTEATDRALSEALDQAESIAAESKNQAKLIVDKATQEASRAVADANGVTEAAEKKAATANSTMAAVESDKRANESRAGELDGLESSLQQKADALASREQELKGEFEKLAEVRGLIDNVLA